MPLRGSDDHPGPSRVAPPDDALTRGTLASTFRAIVPTPLIGRGRELADATERLGPGSVLTIHGPGGVGKTRLAYALAEAVRDDPASFGDGVFVCELAAVTDVEAIPIAVGDAVGVFQNEDASAYESVATGLRGRSAVVVLDNCDPVVGGAARFLTRLLADCPTLAIVVTSREPLRIGLEQLLELGPLDVETDAPVLFEQRARDVDPTFDAAASRATVTAICRSLDGLPLALELAAARLSTMSLSVLAGRLDERFSVLRDSGRIERHATLYATIEWSYDLLGPGERELFDRLSVFQGGFDVAGARSIGRPRRAGTDDALRSLVEKSMVGVRALHDQVDGTSERFELLESLRHFGDRQLAQRGERSNVRNVHLEHTMDVVGVTNSLALGPDWRDALQRLDRDGDNIRAAANWAIDTVRIDDVDRVLRDLFFTSRWRLDAEPASWAQRAIARASTTGAVPGAPAHLHVAFQHFLAGDHARALESNLAGLAARGTPSDRSWCRNYAAVALLYLGRTDEAASMADLMLAERPPRRVEQAMQRSSHAVFKLFAGDYGPDEALVAIARAEATARSTGSVVAIGHVAYNRALCEYARGAVDAYRAAMSEAMTYARSEGINNLTAYVLTAQVYAPGRSGLGVASEALDYLERQHDLSNEFVVLEAAGINLTELRRLEPGAVILGNLEQDRRRIASSAARRAAALGEIRLSRRAQTWLDRGAAMTRAELLEYARSAIADALASL